MNRSRKTLSGVGSLAVAAAAVAFVGGDPSTWTGDEVPAGTWKVVASDAKIIGGYGNNFQYGGEDVRPLEGTARITLDSQKGTGEVVVEVETTEASGPIRFSKDQSWSGKIRIVQKLNTKEMKKARIEEETFLHGDTGNEAPVMPQIYNYLATWGPAKIFVNGEEVVPMIGSHTMLSEQARGPDGRIVNDEGQVYSPKLQDKTGFTNPGETEFHFVSHTTEPDQDNFPPHTGWIHLHFADVEIQEKPAGVEVPYSKAQRAP